HTPIGVPELAAVFEEVQNDNGTDGGQRAVQDVQPASEVPIQPDGQGGTHDTGNPGGELHAHPGDVGDGQAAGVQSVVVGGPDVGAQHDEGGDGQTLGDHHIEDIILPGEGAAHSAEAEHQSIYQEKGDDGGPHRDLAVFCKTDEVGGGGAAGDKGADDVANASDQADAAGRLGEDGGESAALSGGGDHGVHAQHHNEGHGDIADDLQG